MQREEHSQQSLLYAVFFLVPMGSIIAGCGRQLLRMEDDRSQTNSSDNIVGTGQRRSRIRNEKRKKMTMTMMRMKRNTKTMKRKQKKTRHKE